MRLSRSPWPKQTHISEVIVVDLICSHEHRFEGWFASHEDIETQAACGLLTCPSCGSSEVRRLPSAPHVARSNAPAPQPIAAKEPPSPANTAAAAQLQQMLKTLREHAAKAEDVGQRFPEEARKIHYGDAEERAIRGTASTSDTMALLEEGISVLPVPPDKQDLH